MAGVFAHLADDTQTLSQSTRVCRLWWKEDHKYLWRRVQLRDLFRNVRDVARRTQFASIMETISLPADDINLGSTRMLSQPLSFPRLNSITLYKSNLVGVRPSNLQSLIGPSLGSLSLGDTHNPDWRKDENDTAAFFAALMPARATLTSLHLDAAYPSDAENALALAFINGLTAVENLRFGYIAEVLHSTQHPEHFLQMMLSKGRLTALTFPHAVDFTHQSVLIFLAQMGPSWSIPSLQTLSYPIFFSSPAAAQLIARMPNLQHLQLGIEAFSDDLQCLFAAISQLIHLESLYLDINVQQCNLHSCLLVQLAELKQLDSFCLRFRTDPTTVSLSGAQFASFLVGHPRLDSLKLFLGTVKVLYTRGEEETIKTFVAKMEEVEIDDLTLVTQRGLTKCYVETDQENSS
jgi:hypothetical protein